MAKIIRHQDLEVYKKAFAEAMRIFELSKSFPKSEAFSLTDQILLSSRSVCSNTAEGWRKRRYEAAFIAKLNDAEGEAAETQTWLEFTVRCKYLKKEVGRELFIEYDEIIAMVVSMQANPQNGFCRQVKKQRGDKTILSPLLLFSSFPPLAKIKRSRR